MSQRLRLNNAVLFDGERYFPHKRHSVIIEGKRIVEVGPAAPASSGEWTIDLAGMTLMPGLIDAHFHCNSPSLDVEAADKLYPSQMAQYARRNLESALRQGFTTVRDAGGADFGLVKAVDDKLISGPRLFIAGLALSQTGGHGDMRKGISICGCAGYSGSVSRTVDGVDNIRQVVREHLRQGASQIKLFVSGGVLSPSDPIWMDQFSDEEIRAAVEEAERRRAYVMAHALTADSVRRCAALGVRSIEHALEMNLETADFVVAKKSYIVSTLQVVTALAAGKVALPAEMLEKAKRIAEYAMTAVEVSQKAGVTIGLGTDLFGPLHGLELNELTLRSDVSGNLGTLCAATSINAEIMQMKDDIGVIRKGALADLIVIDGDPVSDISVMANPEESLMLVMKDGEIAVDRRHEANSAGDGA